MWTDIKNQLRSVFSTHSRLIISLLLAFLTISIYWQVKDFDFVSFDDYMYVRDNLNIRHGLTLKNIIWAFTSIYAANWHPLTWISHMADIEFFGINPGMHHVTNVLFHVANTLLLFFLLRRMTGAVYKSAIAAALFALHPIHVESVAWVAERKDVLSTFFWMLTMLSYAWYVENRSPGRYLVVAISYLCGLMSKPMLVTLPFTLLLLDFWPLQRSELINTDSSKKTEMWSPGIRWSGIPKLFYEKIPLFILAGSASILTVMAQKKGGSVSTLDMIPLYIRLENTVVSYVAYLEKTFLPFHLAVFYPYPHMFNALTVTLCVSLLIFISLLAVYCMNRFPYFLTGWLWYIGTLVPVIGIVQVGSQSMADRYSYIPLIGIFIILVWGTSALIGQSRSGKYILGIITCIVLPGLMWLSWHQTGTWKNNITLFSHAMKVTEDNYLAHNSLGAALFDLGKVDEAISHYTESLKINPKHMEAHNNLGAALAKQSKYSEAINQYKEAIRLDPKYAGAHYNLGLALIALGKKDEAIKEYRTTTQLEPEHVNAHNNLGFALAEKGNIDEAIAQYKTALDIKPDFIKARLNLITLLSDNKRINDAISEANQGLLYNPKDPYLQFHLAGLYSKSGDKYKAIAEYEKLLTENPSFQPALNNLASLYIEEQKFDSAIALFKNFLKLKPDNYNIYYNIACVYARQNMPDESTNWLKQAVDKGFHDWDLLKKDPDIKNIRQTDYLISLLKNH